MNIGTVIRDTATQLVGGLLTGTLVDMIPFSQGSVSSGSLLKSSAELLAVTAAGSFIAYNWMDMMRRRGWYSGADTANLLTFYASAIACMPKTQAKCAAVSSAFSNMVANSYFTEGLSPTKIPNQDNTAALSIQTNRNHGSPDNNPVTGNIHEEDFPVNLDVGN